MCIHVNVMEVKVMKNIYLITIKRLLYKKNFLYSYKHKKIIINS